ncbi:MAG: UDP-N-acetylmuramoylalanyl-D-glutamyl-2,6-diaminopimelate--D-alanyl-D-alanine ligase [Alphaproteobacteria bacterium]
MTARPLWTGEEVAAATGGKGLRNWHALGVSIDSRTLEPGEFFVALKGPRFDGHDYVGEALRRGAPAALVARRPTGVAADAPLLLVDDALDALTALGRAGRARTRARVVAVTGSVGKTGTKEALKCALAPHGLTVASLRSLNNHWGVPLSLARLPANARFAVLELGMNRAGEIGKLSGLVRPHLALITAVEAVHLVFFDTVAAIADAKAEVFEAMDPDGAAVLNRDNAFYPRLVSAARRRGLTRILGFGVHPSAASRLLDASLGAEGSRVVAEIEGQRVAYTLRLRGRHWVMNSLGVLAVVKALGVEVSEAAAALERLEALPGRGQTHRVPFADGAFELIDDSYNGNPAAMRAALEVLAATPVGPGGRRIAVLGDMLEMGREAPQLHADLGDHIAEAGVELTFTAGVQMKHLRVVLDETRRGAHAETAESLVPHVVGAVRSGDVVLVKGSRAMAMELVVEALLSLASGAGSRVASGG